MSFLTRWFPAGCSRQRIFICYAREDRELAHEIGQTLTNDGHDVFIDANSLKVATDFNEEIRRGIERADRFIFLASKHSLAPGAYPLTELGFAEKQWPAPKGAVWPVIVDPQIDPATLPVYLRAVQVHTPKGNIVAELAAEIEASRSVRGSCLLGAFAVLALLAGAGAIAAMGPPGRASFALQTPQQIDFRPAKKPGPDDAWKASAVALTLIPVSYTNDGRTVVRIVDETVRLDVAGKAVAFKWHNEVEMRANCGADWLCTKTSAGPATLAPQGTLRREMMFMPAPAQSLTWQAFVDFVCRSSADTLNVTLIADSRASGLLGASGQTKQATCRIDLKSEREKLRQRGCVSDNAQLPLRLSPKCGP